MSFYSRGHTLYVDDIARAHVRDLATGTQSRWPLPLGVFTFGLLREPTTKVDR